MSNDSEELRVSDLMRSQAITATSKNEGNLFSQAYKNNLPSFSIIKKIFPHHRKEILLFPLCFILLLSICQVVMLYGQSNSYDLKVSFKQESVSKWLDSFSFLNSGVTKITEIKSPDQNSRNFVLKFQDEQKSSDFPSIFEKRAIQFLENEHANEKSLILNQVESIRAKIHQSRISGSPEFLQLRSEHDIHEFLLHGEESLKKRVEYYHKILYIDDFARHNVIEVFHLRKKELEIPLLKELEQLSVLIQKESPAEVKRLMDNIKAKEDEYLEELMQKEMEEIPEKYLTPARKELLQEEKKLRVLFYEWKMSESLYQAYREKLEKNKSDSIDKLLIQSDLRLAENLMKKMEALVVYDYKSQSPVKISMKAVPAEGLGLSQIILFTAIFLLGYVFLWAKLIADEKRSPIISSLEELSARLNLIVTHQITSEDLKFTTETIDANPFYQQVSAYYSQAKNIVGKTDLILFQSCNQMDNVRDLAYLYAFGIAAGQGRVCLVDSMEKGQWEKLGQLDRNFTFGIIDMINGKCDLKDSVYGTEFKNLFVTPINNELRISKTRNDLNAGSQWDCKFDKIVFAINDLLVDDVLHFFKNHHIIIYYMVSPGDSLLKIEDDIKSFRTKNATVKIIFKK